MAAKMQYNRAMLLDLGQKKNGKVDSQTCDTLHEFGIHTQSSHLPCAARATSVSERITPRDSSSYTAGGNLQTRGDTSQRETSAGLRNTRGHSSYLAGSQPERKSETKYVGGVSIQSKPDGSYRTRTFVVDNFANIDEPDAMAMQVLRNVKGLEELLRSPDISPLDSQMLLTIFAKITKSQHHQIVLKILQCVCSSSFLDKHVPVMIRRLQATGQKEQITTRLADFVIQVVEGIHQIVQTICQKLPSWASKASLLLSFLFSAESIMLTIRRGRPKLEEDLQNLQKECDGCILLVQNVSRQKTAVRRMKGKDEDDVMPPEDFTQLPIFPGTHDMDWTEKPFLRANKSEGAFKDVGHYLDVQFRLLREDYIRPLRNGIREYQRLKRGGECPAKVSDLRLYHRVRIVGLQCKEILEHRLQFDNSHLQKVNWEYSKRLQYGNLVCLTTDDFNTIFFAIITNTEVTDRNNGIVQVAFEGHLEEVLEMSTDAVFTMAETTAFFESYRHVLEGLQQIQVLPMRRYIVGCQTEVTPPKYLVATGSTKMNLSAILKEGSKCNVTSVSAMIPRTWPPLEELALNKSQLEAVQTALTKELAIIQGPPGTGKTYVGLKIAHVLLDNKQLWTNPDPRPMLVVCYTNHALDQFLEGILKFCPKGIVRVGGRSKSESLKEFNLKEIRRQKRANKELNWSVCGSFTNSFHELEELGAKVERSSAIASVLSRSILKETLLVDCMLPGQYSSLTKLGPYSLVEKGGNLVADWLAFGRTLLGQEESDPYSLLAQELTWQILNGTDSSDSQDVNQENVWKVPYKTRAQMYRTWLRRLLDKPAHATSDNSPASEDARKLRERAQSEILPDYLLQHAADSDLYSAIRSPLMNRQSELTKYCIRAWLGVGTSKEAVSRIVKDVDDNCKENDFSLDPESVLRVPRSVRVRLYRFWLMKLTGILTRRIEKDKKHGRVRENDEKMLQKAQTEILSDSSLRHVVGGTLLSAVKREIQKRLEERSKFCIRSWLGFADLSRNPQGLEGTLEKLTNWKDEDTRPSTTGAEKDQGQKDGDDATVPDERHLDDADDELFRHDLNKGLGDALTLFDTEGDAAGQDEVWSIPKSLKRKRIRQVQRFLQSAKPMTEDEAKKVTELWNPKLTLEDRVRLYKFWVTRFQPLLKRSLVKDAEAFVQESKLYQELKFAGDCEIMRQASVIGMTTTGAARYRAVLAKVGCPIVMLEEAAEVLEAHVVTTLHESCQHLILIGDHQQLRPSPTVYDLCRHYQLDLSLFERLVNNKLHHTTLTVQHRMRPEVSRLVRHVYPHLQDHVTTEERPHIQGMTQAVFVFHHEVVETTHDETSSKSNVHEAEMCVGLCRYLLQQRYRAETITMLAAYTGQVLLFKSIMNEDKDYFKGVFVTSIDNYQGEENDIIILSLVRSNEDGIVGFLGTDNRVCVALSRARNGLYAFGNFRILVEKSELWRNVVKTAKENNQMGKTLVLRCLKHSHTYPKVTVPEDFKNVPHGGCSVPCSFQLGCGHACRYKCHPFDPDHKQYSCEEKCDRQICAKGLHPCPKKCHEMCDKCKVMVDKTVPICGHVEKITCYTSEYDWSCSQKCQTVLDCGHRCSGKCGDCQMKMEHITECPEIIEHDWPCGHRVKAPCHKTAEDLLCPHPCGSKLECGHDCTGTCGQCFGGRVHLTCKAPCEKTLKACGHQCSLTCGSKCLPCQKQCVTYCRHSKCVKPCGEPCTPCSDPCPWKCDHTQCKATCGSRCKPCLIRCSMPLDCGHPCMGYCGEKCRLCVTCEVSKIIPLSKDSGNILLPSQAEAESKPKPSIETPLSENAEPLSMKKEALAAKESSAVPTVDKSALYIKFANCGHIFQADYLDAYAKGIFKSASSYGLAKLPCPSCSQGFFVGWRYQHLFQKYHTAWQAIKQKHVDATTVSKDRQEKILKSIARLNKPEKLLSAEERTKLGETRLDVNRGLALTVHTKLAKVTELALDLLRTYSILGPLAALSDFRADCTRMEKRVRRLGDVLRKAQSSMTDQRCRELVTETRRLTYMVVLLCAKWKDGPAKEEGATVAQQAVTFFSILDAQPSEDSDKKEKTKVTFGEIDRFFGGLRESCGWWREVDDAMFSILDAPLEQELSEIHTSRDLQKREKMALLQAQMNLYKSLA